MFFRSLLATRPLLVAVALLALFGVACTATPNYIEIADSGAMSIEDQNAASLLWEADDLVLAADSTDPALATEDAPASLAFADDDPNNSASAAATANAPSDEFCAASSKVWVRTEALDVLEERANPQMTQVAFTRIAEAIEQSSLFDEPGADSRASLFGAFQILRDEFMALDTDWHSFRSGDTWADNPAAVLYDREHSELVRFLDEDCAAHSTEVLDEDVAAQVLDLIAGWGIEASTVAISETLRGHSIFTHSSGRLIATFPTHWDYREVTTSDALVDFIAARDVDKFLLSELVEGARVRLVEANTIDDFRQLLAETGTGATCSLVDDTTVEVALVRITQNYECADHGAMIEGRYNADRQIGLIVEGSFRGPQPTNAQLTRLAQILQSVLWS